jgi:glycosyltransferase involved in cell wall biosynthesis
MIVKNGSPLLKDTLLTIKDYIDHWTILDTGSIDGSQDCIREILKNIPGNLYEEPFVDFEVSRNRSLELAGTICEYNIILDDSYMLYGCDKLREFLKNQIGESNNAFSIIIKDENSFYDSIRIIRSSSNLKYKYKVHELIICTNPKLIDNNDIFIKDISDNKHKVRSTERHKKDIQILLQEHKKYPKDLRIVFYLGNTYLALGKYDESLTYYKKRVKLAKQPNEHEVYRSLYQIGILYDFKKDWNNAEKYFMKAYNMRPFRAEPIYHIAKHYYTNNDLNKAEIFLSNLIKIKIPTKDLDCFIVDHKIYNFDIPYLLIELYFKKGITNIEYKNKAILFAEKLFLEYPDSTNLKNMLYNSRPDQTYIVKKYNKKCIVLHTGDMCKPWCPTNYINSGISGSEFMAMNLAKMFAIRDYKVFIVGKCENLEGVYDGVEYINISKYEDLVQKTYIDYLIISRFPENLRYYNNIENVYFWLHDILPFNPEFQTHKTKFKKIICLSEWHKKFFIDEYKFPIEKVDIIGNAIDFTRFTPIEKIKKIPYRFIYSSSFDRGFKYLLKMFPQIHNKFPNAELYAFIDEKSHNIFKKSKEYIDSQDFIFIKNRISQSELSIEMMKSDIWLYPTDFEETYCITALEAQASKCLCICTNIGALNTIVGDRGIIIKGSIEEETTQNNLLQELFNVLENPQRKEKLIESGYNWAMKQDFSYITNKWENLFNS